MSGSKFQPHFVRLCDQLDLDKLLPYLKQERMVTNDEYETLTNIAYTKKQRREKLLIYLPRKGKLYFEKFGKCLVWSGQVELARHIGVDVESVPAAPYQIDDRPPAGGDPQDILHAIRSLIIPGGGQSEIPGAQHHSLPPPYPSGGYHPNQTQATPSLPFNQTHTTSLPFNQTQTIPSLPFEPIRPSYPSQTPGSHVMNPPPSEPQRPYYPPAPEAYAVNQYCTTTSSGAPQELPPVPAPQPPRPSGPKKVFVLYCKDTDQVHVTDSDSFCRDIHKLERILSYSGGITVTIDISEEFQQNWDRWTQEKIRESDYVIMVCSPMLIQHLNSSQGDRRDVSMYIGRFFHDTVVNTICAPKFIPVFLNECKPRSLKEWLPAQLHMATIFELSTVREFHDNFIGGAQSDVVIMDNIMKGFSHPRHARLADFVRSLRGDPPPSTPPRPPIPLPTDPEYEYISENSLLEMCNRLRREWMHLGIKLGVGYGVMMSFRERNPGNEAQAAMAMIREWQRIKGREATRRTLKRALLDINYGQLAADIFPNEKL